MSIEIAISTLNDGIHSVCVNNDGFHYLVIHQITNGNNYHNAIDKLIREGIKYYHYNEKGLSLSRNQAIKRSAFDYIWIMDDDVEIFSDSKARVERLVDSYPGVDAFILNHSSDIDKRLSSKKFKEISYISAASVSSIDILIKRSSVINNNIYFDERFGLGTSLPSGEEYIFITDMLKNGLAVLQTNLVVSHHPPAASGHDFYSTPQKIKAKKAIFQRIFGTGIISRFMFFIFILKKSLRLLKQKKLNAYLLELISK